MVKDNGPTPSSEGSQPTKEAEPVQPELMEALPIRQEAVVPVVQESVIELPTSLRQQAQQEQELSL